MIVILKTFNKSAMNLSHCCNKQYKINSISSHISQYAVCAMDAFRYIKEA